MLTSRTFVRTDGHSISWMNNLPLFDGYRRLETTHGPTSSVATSMGLLHGIKDSENAFICTYHLSINDFCDGDYVCRTSTMMTRGPETSVKLCRRKYGGRRAATEVAAMQQRLVLSSYTQGIHLLL